MWRCDDTPFKTNQLLRTEIWNLALWVEQALSDDGEAAQPWARGAGLACVKMCARPGEEFIFRERAEGKDAITKIFGNVEKKISQASDEHASLQQMPYAGNIYMGHLRYSTTGKLGLSFVHPSCVATIIAPRISFYAATST